MYEKKKKSKRNFTQNATARSPGRDLVTDVTVVRQQPLLQVKFYERGWKNQNLVRQLGSTNVR